MIYFIGGAPRTGKSQLALKALGWHQMPCVSTDAVRSIMTATILHKDLPKGLRASNDSWDNPDMFVESYPEDIYEVEQDVARDIWTGVKALIARYDEEGKDVLIEGSAVLPEFLEELEIEHKAIFIGNTSESHHEMLVAISRTNPNDWMSSYTTEQLTGCYEYFKFASEKIRDDADSFGHQYYEMHDESFDEDLEIASQDLVES